MDEFRKKKLEEKRLKREYLDYLIAFDRYIDIISIVYMEGFLSLRYEKLVKNRNAEGQ